MVRGREASTRWRRAHVVAAPIAGGVFDHVLDAARFDPDGPVPIVVPPWPGLDRAVRRAAALGVEVLRLAPAPRAGGVGDWLASRPLELVHMHYATPFDCTVAVEAALATGIAVVSTDHTDPVAAAAEHAAPAAAWARRRRVAPLQAARLADSAAIASGLAPELGCPVQVVAHGIDVEHFAASPPRPAARQALGLDPQRAVVGVVAALFGSKRVDRVLAAAAQLEPPALVLVAGEGPERPRLAALAAALAVETRFLGWVDDVRPVLAAADVLAHASRVEGLPSVVLQAMAAGVPVVATDVPGTAEALGPHGARVQHDDDGRFAAALARALAGRHHTDREAARARVAAYFDARRMAAAIGGVHRAALAARVSRPPADVAPRATVSRCRSARLARAADPHPS
jgi:glycosyltransferase involved in cell wall biosynthesis